VGEGAELRRRVGERCAEILGAGDDAVPVGEVYVGWFAALDARACPSRFRAGGEGGWGFPGWSAPLAAAAAGRAALALHVTGGEPLGAPPPLPDPVAAVRTWMKAVRSAPEGGVGRWVAERMDERDEATLAAVAAGATRWLAGFVRVLGWPLPPHLLVLGTGGSEGGRPLQWRPPRPSPVMVASGADARVGKVVGSGDFAVVVHRQTSGDDGGLRGRAAFEATAATLAIGVVPASVLVTAGDTGERVRVPVDTALLDAGAELVVNVVEQRVVATGRGHDPADATPSPACRHCDELAACAPGRSWLAGPGRWRGGLPVL
jgi:hypothetical protein